MAPALCSATGATVSPLWQWQKSTPGGRWLPSLLLCVSARGIARVCARQRQHYTTSVSHCLYHCIYINDRMNLSIVICILCRILNRFPVTTMWREKWLESHIWIIYTPFAHSFFYFFHNHRPVCSYSFITPGLLRWNPSWWCSLKPSRIQSCIPSSSVIVHKNTLNLNFSVSQPLLWVLDQNSLALHHVRAASSVLMNISKQNQKKCRICSSLESICSTPWLNHNRCCAHES